MTDNDRTGAERPTPGPLPRLWRTEQAALTLRAAARGHHLAAADLLRAYGAPAGALQQVEQFAAAQDAHLAAIAAELRDVRHHLSRVLP